MPHALASLITTIGEPFETAEVEIDSPRGREVLIDVKASGLCHSDLTYATNDFGMRLPLLLGHEAAGIVIAVGPDVREVSVGDHVVSGTVPSCGVCAQCLEGHRSSCLAPGFAQRTADADPRVTLGGEPVTQAFGVGGFASKALISEGQLVTIDPLIPFDRACLLGCGVVTGAGAIMRSAKVQPGESVVIVGAGGVGLNAVQAAGLVGASSIIVVDLQPEKLELAKKFGATHTVNPADGDAVDQVMAITEGKGVDHAFEMIGLLPTLQQVIRMLGRRGTAYIVGLQKPGTSLEFPVAPGTSKTLSWEQGIRGVFMGSSNFKVDVPYFGKLYLQGRLNLDDLVSETIDISEINRGYESLRSGKVARTVITF